MDVEAVQASARWAVDHARSGEGPVLLESLTYRYYGHSRSDPTSYRTKQEEQEWKSRDPIQTFAARLEARGELCAADLQEMDRCIEEVLASSVEFADASEYPQKCEIFTDIYALQEEVRSSRILTYREALGEAIGEEMERNESVFLFGEDVGAYGGAYKVSRGLIEKFGARR